MPSRDLVREFAPDSYYHIYNHGVHGQPIFIDNNDYAFFLSLFKRHLSINPSADQYRRSIAHLRDSVELLAFCLMPNHFHLLIHNSQELGMVDLMRRISVSYSIYFNKTL